MTTKAMVSRTVEYTDEQLWNKFKADPNFFEHVYLAKDGGLSDIPKLFSSARWLQAAVLIVFVVTNVLTIIDSSAHIFVNESWFQQGQDGNDVLLTNWLANLVGWSNPIKPQKILGLYELALLTAYLVRGLLFAYTAKNDIDVRSWYAVADIYWEILPHLSNVSALRLLQYVLPAVLIPKLSAEVKLMIDRNNKLHASLALSLFIISRFIFLVVGFDAFLMKLQAVARSIIEESAAPPLLLVTAGAFLNQMLGVIQLDRIMKTRLYKFIFGGEDSVLSDSQKAMLRIWEGMLAQKIFSCFTTNEAIALMLTFSAADFQRIAVNEKELRWKRSTVSEFELQMVQ